VAQIKAALHKKETGDFSADANPPQVGTRNSVHRNMTTAEKSCSDLLD
jgi:hypothetical protein